MTREEILSKLTTWFDDGILTTSVKEKLNANEIDKRSNAKELSYTPHSRVLFVGDSNGSPIYDELCNLFNEYRLLTPLQARVKKNLRTLYSIHKAVNRGELMRFERDGAIIYID